MNRIFKYMDFLGLEYIDNPTARISLIQDLNDPFECNLSSSVGNLIVEYTKAINLNLREKGEDEVSEEQVAGFIFNAMRGIGVISFSETNRNLLMWAHYANNHSGICVEVESDWSSSKEKLSDTHSNTLHCFKRVQYDTRRVDFREIASLQHGDLDSSIVDLCIKQLTLKSDEWMYEKEHRNIMSFLEADYVKQKKRTKIPKSVKDKMSYYLEKENICLGNNGYETTYCKDMNFLYETFKCNSFMYLTKIPPQKIKSIYLGHRFDEKIMRKIINKIKNPEHPLHHISLHKCSISNTRFEIDTRVVY